MTETQIKEKKIQESDFGDFEEVKEENSSQDSEKQEKISFRVRLPKGIELIGIITQRLGGNRMEVKTTDGKNRNCRVPGRYKRKLWLRPKNIVIIVPWEFENNKGEVIYKYQPTEIYQLRKKGLLNSLIEEF